MAYIGNIPAEKYQTLQKQSFTTSATDTYTLSYSVTNPQDLALFINNVRQNPNDAYTVSGTTLTLSSAITSSDTMYAVFLGRAVETIAPATGSVTNAMLAGSIANSKLANSSITLNGSAVSLGGSATVANTPAFRAFNSSNQNVSTATLTTLSFNSETFDSDGTYDTSTNRFTPAVAGKYVIFAHVRDDDTNAYQLELEIRTSAENAIAKSVINNTNKDTISAYTIADLSTDEYVFVTAYHSQGGTRTLLGGTSQAYFGGFKVIGA
jgi:hypothetical protein